MLLDHAPAQEAEGDLAGSVVSTFAGDEQVMEPPVGSGGDGSRSPGDRILRLLDEAWIRLCALPWPAFAGGLVTLTLLRSGIAPTDLDMGSWLRLTRAFPTVVPEWRMNSILGPALAKSVGVTTVDQWMVLHSVLIVAVIALIAGTLRDRFATASGRRLAGIWIAVGAVPPVILQKVGSYDVYVVAGAVLVLLNRRVTAIVLGGILIGATSAEQGTLGLLAAGCVLLALESRAPAAQERTAGKRDWSAWFRHDVVARRLAIGAAAILVTRVLLLASFATQGTAVPSRASVFPTHLHSSIANALHAGSAGVFTWMGLGWVLLLVAAAAGAWTRRQWIGVLLGLVILPAALTVTTLDGTRVFAMVSLPAVLVLLGWVLDRVEDGRFEVAFVQRVTTAVLLLSPLVPALITEPNGHAFFTFPWAG